MSLVFEFEFIGFEIVAWRSHFKLIIIFIIIYKRCLVLTLLLMNIWMSRFCSLELRWLFKVFKFCNFLFLIFKFSFKLLINATCFKHFRCNFFTLMLNWFLDLTLLLSKLLLLEHFNLLLMHSYHISFSWTLWITRFFYLI